MNMDRWVSVGASIAGYWGLWVYAQVWYSCVIMQIINSLLKNLQCLYQFSYGVTPPQFKMLYLKWQVCISIVLETGYSRVQKLPGVVSHESQFSVLQMPVFSSDCILTARAGPGTSHSPILAQRGGDRDSTGRDRTGSGGTPDRWHTTTPPSRSHLRTRCLSKGPGPAP